MQDEHLSARSLPNVVELLSETDSLEYCYRVIKLSALIRISFRHRSVTYGFGADLDVMTSAC